MQNRLDKIITKYGDTGVTELPGLNHRISKGSDIFECIGAVDEANSYIGYSRTVLKNELSQFNQLLDTIQNDLFDMTADIIKTTSKIQEEHIDYITEQAEQIKKALPPLKSFIIPKGVSSSIHLARVNIRKAERKYWRFMNDQIVSLMIQENQHYPGKYLNRLSDLLFIIGRYINHHCKDIEEIWNKK